jgi:hypothetical protein
LLLSDCQSANSVLEAERRVGANNGLHEGERSHWSISHE